jgi:hypothetical protein
VKYLAVPFAVLLLAATVSAQSVPASAVAYDYGAMYAAVNPSIVKVHADAKHGSGFLVSTKGFIATNHHVVKNARYLAIEFADGRKVPCEVVRLDSRFDLAIIRVHPSTVEGLAPLPLLPREKDSRLRAGTPVVAFGSPRSLTFLITQGVISKVEDRSLLGDFLITHGNSGGPLLNLDGEVVGVNTFLSNDTFSGAVRIHLLRDALAMVENSPDLGDPPSAETLPTLSGESYEPEVLKNKILNEPLEEEVYRLDGGKFVVTALTPVLMAKAQIQTTLVQAANRYKRRGKKIKDPNYVPIDEPYYDWQRDSGPEMQNAVTIEIRPDFGTTTGSKWRLGLAAFAGGRQAVDNTVMAYEYKAEFEDFKLYRDGKFVQPVTPGRALAEAAMVQRQMIFVDEAYAGYYVYDPRVFLEGEEFRFEIYDAREPGKVHKTINLKSDSKLIRQIRADFASSAGQ